MEGVRQSVRQKRKADDALDGSSGGVGDGAASGAPAAKRAAPARPPTAQQLEARRLREIKNRRKEALEQLLSEQNRDVESTKARNKDARLRWLLQQTDIYSHFVTGGEASPLKKSARKGKGKKGKGGGGGGGGESQRARRSEKEEDEELLHEELEGDREHFTYLTKQPDLIKFGKLRAYQLEGLNWLIRLYENGINGILADEMGLGKTLQTISLLAFLKESEGVHGPHIVIVPKSTLGNWINEFTRWCPAIKAVKFHGNREQRNALKTDTLVAGQFDVCVTSYEMCLLEKNFLKRFSWQYLIIDEAHRIKNEQSVLSQVVRVLNSNFRLLITGTPLQNNMKELWALLNFLLPEVFSSSDEFQQWFDIGSRDGDVNTDMVQKLHKILRPFLLRRLKHEVERAIPPKVETKLFVGMSKMQKEWYTKVLMRDIEAINGQGGKDKVRLLNILMHLRKVCNHPYLFDGAEPGPPYTTGEHLVETSGKLVLLDKLLPRLAAQGSRVLVFSQMTRMLDILEDYCTMREFEYCRIDGSTPGDEREEQIEEFNAPGSKQFIFLLSTRAGGLGINLATADVVILYDSDWNPQMDLQAQDRAHRIGQRKEVKVFRFVTEDACEEKIVERAERKLQLDALVIQQGRLQEKLAGPSRDEMMTMVRYGADKVFSSKDSTITEQDIDDILRAGKKRTDEMNAKLQDAAQQSLYHFQMSGEMDMYKFGGKDYRDEKNLAPLPVAQTWIAPPKRERKITYNIDEYYRSVLRTSSSKKKAKGPKKVRMPKLMKLPPYHFYPAELHALVEKEGRYLLHRVEQEQKKADAAAAGAGSSSSSKSASAASTPTPAAPTASTPTATADTSASDAAAGGGEAAAAAAAAEEVDADAPPPLTEEEQARKKELLETTGFPEWQKRDVHAFVRASERHGRNALPHIAEAMAAVGFDEEQVRAFHKVFWERLHELPDHERFVKHIERGELKIQRRKDVQDHISKFVEQWENPLRDMRIPYGGNRGRGFTEENDRYLLYCMHTLGYGNVDDLKYSICRSHQFRFDWWFRSRNQQELTRRCETLARNVQKANQRRLAAANGNDKAK